MGRVQSPTGQLSFGIQWARESWALGRGSIAAGRNADVVALYQGKLDTMEDYEYEQSSFVLLAALGGASQRHVRYGKKSLPRC